MNKPEFSRIDIYRNKKGKAVGVQAVIANPEMITSLSGCDDKVKELLKIMEGSSYGIEYTPVVIVYDTDDEDPKAKVWVIDDDFGVSDVLAKVAVTSEEQLELYNELNKYMFAEEKTTITEYIEDAQDEDDEDDDRYDEDRYNEEWS